MRKEITTREREHEAELKTLQERVLAVAALAKKAAAIVMAQEEDVEAIKEEYEAELENTGKARLRIYE